MAWLRYSLPTQFNEKLAHHWSSVRQKSQLYAFVLGEFFRVISDEYVPLEGNALECRIEGNLFEEIIFGEAFGTYSSFTGIKHISYWDQSMADNLLKSDHLLTESFSKGYFGDYVDQNRIECMTEELTRLISDEEVTHGIQFHRPQLSKNVYKSELADKDSEISLLRSWVAKLTGSTTP